MLERAIELAGGSVYRRTSAWDWIGYYIEDATDLWTGIRYAKPAQLLLGFDTQTANLELFNALQDNDEGDTAFHREWNDGKPQFYMNLEDEAVHFFALSKESQLVRLTDFVRRARQAAIACMTAGTTGGVS